MKSYSFHVCVYHALAVQVSEAFRDAKDLQRHIRQFLRTRLLH